MWFSHTFFLYSKYKCMYLKHNIDVCYEVLNFFISTGVVQHRCMHCFNNLCIGSIFFSPSHISLLANNDTSSLQHLYIG